MKFTVKIEKPNDVHNWDDLLDPEKKDIEEHGQELMNRYQVHIEQSMQIVKKSDCILSINRTHDK